MDTMTHTVYLHSYDRYVDVLEYHLPDGTFKIIHHDEWEKLGIPLTMGNFCSEDHYVAGVFATPEGPVFFLNSQHVVGRYRWTVATLEKLPPPPKCMKRFTLFHKELYSKTVEFGVIYTERFGIGTNPYDNEEEDVDLFAWIERMLKSEASFKLFTKDWVG
jgi:hypothetical protein